MTQPFGINNNEISKIDKFDIIKGWTESGYANFNKESDPNELEPLGEQDSDTDSDAEFSISSKKTKLDDDSSSEVSVKSDKFSRFMKKVKAKKLLKKPKYTTVFIDEPFL